MADPADVGALVRLVQVGLAELAVPEDAPVMQAYLKTDMPMYGVKKGASKELERAMKRQFWPRDRATWEAGVLALWTLPHREEKALALRLAAQHKRFLTLDALPLCERLVREGQWWDLVDEVADKLVGRIVIADPEPALDALERWVTDEDVWVRRVPLICQLKRKQDTDAERLFRWCEALAGDDSFWIRKAIGWALREYGKTDGDAVVAFVEAHAGELSGLSRREGLRRLRGE